MFSEGFSASHGFQIAMAFPFLHYGPFLTALAFVDVGTVPPPPPPTPSPSLPPSIPPPLSFLPLPLFCTVGRLRSAWHRWANPADVLSIIFSPSLPLSSCRMDLSWGVNEVICICLKLFSVDCFEGRRPDVGNFQPSEGVFMYPSDSLVTVPCSQQPPSLYTIPSLFKFFLNTHFFLTLCRLHASSHHDTLLVQFIFRQMPTTDIVDDVKANDLTAHFVPVYLTARAHWKSNMTSGAEYHPVSSHAALLCVRTSLLVNTFPFPLHRA